MFIDEVGRKSYQQDQDYGIRGLKDKDITLIDIHQMACEFYPEF